MTSPAFTIKPVQLDDVPTLAKLSAIAFETDRQTIMKGLGSAPFSMEAHNLSSLPRNLSNPRIVILKAVDDATGDIMGYVEWGFRGIPDDQMPAVPGRLVAPQAPTPAPATPQPAPPAAHEKETAEERERRNAPVQRLIALQNEDMAQWMKDVMPEGVKCLFIVGLHVAPAYQNRGVASALLRFGTSFCDAHADEGVFAWVHSSEGAWKVYQKCGFEVERVLDCDLDAYAPAPPPEGLGSEWGHYVLRYMRYRAKK